MRAAAVRMRQQDLVVVVPMIMVVLTLIMRMAMIVVGMVVVIMVLVAVVRVYGSVDMMVMRMLDMAVRMAMPVRIVCGGVRGAVRVLLRGAPALRQQNDAHPQHQQARCETEDWKQPLGHEEARSGEGGESQNKDTHCMCECHGNPEKHGMTGRAT